MRISTSFRVPSRFRPAIWLLIAALAGAGLLSRSDAPDPTSLLSDLYLAARAEGVFASDVSRLPRAEVLSVVDGDTLRVRWQGKEERLRYYGVNTPERGDACFEEASRRNAALAGATVLLAFDARPRDKYGRLLAYAFTPEGLSIDARLVNEGLGRAWTRDGRWRDGMEALEKEARREKRGCLWEKPAKSRRMRRAIGSISKE